MLIFFNLLFKIIPLYIFIILGYVGGRFLKIDKESIATLLIDIVVPVVVFTGVVTTKIALSTISLPVLFFFICLFISLLTYLISGFIWKDSNRNILSFMTGTGNTGYFGLPVAIALFGNDVIGTVAAVVLATNLYTTSIGYYIAAKGHHSAKDSLIKVLKLPILHAFILGVLVNLLEIKMGKVYFDLASYFTGTYTILGMMLVGMGLSDIKDYGIDIKFIAVSFLAKFLLWPAVAIAILLIDYSTIKIFDPSLYKVIILMTIVPIAANMVSYATILKSHPEKVSMAVLLSTIFALFYIPLIAAIYLK